MSMSSILAAGARYVCAVVDTVQVTPNCVLLWSTSTVARMPTTAFNLNSATVYPGKCHGYSLPSWRARRFGLAKFCI